MPRYCAKRACIAGGIYRHEGDEFETSLSLAHPWLEEKDSPAEEGKDISPSASPAPKRGRPPKNSLPTEKDIGLEAEAVPAEEMTTMNMVK